MPNARSSTRVHEPIRSYLPARALYAASPVPGLRARRQSGCPQDYATTLCLRLATRSLRHALHLSPDAFTQSHRSSTNPSLADSDTLRLPASTWTSQHHASARVQRRGRICAPPELGFVAPFYTMPWPSQAGCCSLFQCQHRGLAPGPRGCLQLLGAPKCCSNTAVGQQIQAAGSQARTPRLGPAPSTAAQGQAKQHEGHCSTAPSALRLQDRGTPPSQDRGTPPSG